MCNSEDARICLMMNDEDSWRALRIKAGPGQAFRAASIGNVLS